MNRTGRSRETLVEGRETVSLLRLFPFRRSRAWDVVDAPRSAFALSVDHPRRGERILSPTYTFRVETSLPDPVEVSIDGEEWKPCRRAVGYWWYDWSDYRPGLHQAVFRLRPRGAEKTPTKTCLFRVDLGGAGPRG